MPAPAFRCLTCETAYTTAQQSPACPKCGSGRVRWLPRGDPDAIPDPADRNASSPRPPRRQYYQPITRIHADPIMHSVADLGRALFGETRWRRATARAIGIHPRTLNNWEVGAHRPSSRHLRQLLVFAGQHIDGIEHARAAATRALRPWLEESTALRRNPPTTGRAAEDIKS